MNSRRIFSNFMWRLLERTGAQLISFIVSIILARILDPDAYGTISLILVFTTIMQVFVDSGLGNALIQKKNSDEVDFSTVFYTNIAFCIILYAIIFVFSPAIADFYGDPKICEYMRVLGITILISGIKNVQQAYVSKNLFFRKFFFSTLGGTIAAGSIGIILALSGGGVWALVAQQVTNITIDTMILWSTVQWRPQPVFSLSRLKGLFSYGWKLLMSSLLEKIYQNLRQLIIGRMYSAADLAYYNQGEKFPDVIVSNINTSIDSVLLPIMSENQDNKSSLKKMTRTAIKTSTYIMAPLMVGLAFTAESVISIVLTDKWLGCVPYLRIFCIALMFQPIHTANLNAIKAMGRSDLFLKLEVIKKIIGIIVLLTSMWYGVMAMAYSLLITSFLYQMINARPNKKLLNYGYLEQLKDIFPGIVLSVIMGIFIYPIQWIKIPDSAILAIQILAGIVIYVACSIFFKMESFTYLMSIIKVYMKSTHK
ncbi:MAG: lipopolysaccharide biosynthesis protein [Lachnospiraceae bacterium]|nr:lipopolysaccharide biosynthesis protein [Lachnospiraceae bacterium]